MATIKEIAEKLGISTTTVSNVIHGKTGKMSADTRKKIEEALVTLPLCCRLQNGERDGGAKTYSGKFLPGRQRKYPYGPLSAGKCWERLKKNFIRITDMSCTILP